MYSLENVHALIIEDDQTSIDVLKNLLDQLAVNTSIIRVVNGRDVWDSLRVVAVPDVIFLDLEMPGMNGYEVLDLLREDEELGAVPVVAYTTHISHMNNARRAVFTAFWASRSTAMNSATISCVFSMASRVGGALAALDGMAGLCAARLSESRRALPSGLSA